MFTTQKRKAMAMDKKTLLVSLSLVLFISSSSQYGKVGADLNPNERQALLTLRATVGGRSQLWNTTNNPCTWPGVFCSKKQDTVVELHLPGMGLFGQLPLGLGNLTNLQTLSLRFNALSGSVPPDLANLNGSLRNLYLQGNSFSGEVPGFLFGMQNLVRLNLARNNFSGKMSKDFKNLVRLGTLYLEENHLTGSIPDVDSLAGLDQFNVSYNKLTGRIPKQVDHFPKTSFEGNSLCGGPLVACKKKKLSGGAIAGIIIGCIIGLLLILMVLLLLLLCVMRRRKKKGEEGKTRNVEEQSKEVGDVEIPREKVVSAVAGGSGGNAGGLGTTVGKSGGANSLVFFGDIAGRKFDLEDLLRASAEVLGKGTFGTAYKATLDAGVVVAVKRLKDVAVPEKELREKMEVVGRMNHENLVALRAYYYSRDEKLLVYDYMPMGSLSALLHGNRGAGRTPLNWETRSSIALGAARGIAYIHSQGSASHGNIKSSNILLTTSYEARVSDFGLAHLAVPTPTPNRIDGYRAPEVTDPRKVSQKADVYSFGVFLLELLTGKPPTHSLNNDEGVDLPRWVQSVVREEWSAEVFDPELLRYQTVEEDMVQLLQLAVDCTAQYPDSRPTMAEVRTRMEDICCPSSRQEEAGGDHNGHEIIDDGGSQHAYSVGSGAPPP